MSRISSFLYAICILFLPAVDESVGGSNVKEEDEQTNSSISSSTTVSDLPASVVHDILQRLPHKSFTRCKSVCKSWLNLISDPYFTKHYFTNPPFTALVLYQRHFVNDTVSFRFLEIDDSNGDVTFAPCHPRALDFLVNDTEYLDIKGSCNGLLCITQTHLDTLAIYVINPLLGEFLELPPVGFGKIMEDYVLYGFGCSRNSNRYELLRVVKNRNTGEVHKDILAVGVDEKWRSFEDASLTMELIRDGVAMNGAVHLLGDDNGRGFILAFDVEEERGRHINLPPGLKDKPCYFNLAVSDDKLWFIDNYSDTHVNIWTMKEYGDVESWSKETILSGWVPDPVELNPYPQLVEPITTLRNRDLLMENVSGAALLHLTSYNRTVKMCTKHEVNVDT